MTSNLGSHLIQEKTQSLTEKNRDEIMGGLRVQLLELLRQTIRPEFLNRIDEIILFKPLTLSEICKIVDLQLHGIQNLVAAKDISIEFTEDLRNWLAQAGFDPSFGARPLKRTIQKHIVNRLSEKILAGEIVPGDRVEANAGERGDVEFITRAKTEAVK
jgi:ATP-dependent Clp protease ATP-binding subunit ClpB